MKGPTKTKCLEPAGCPVWNWYRSSTPPLFQTKTSVFINFKTLHNLALFLISHLKIMGSIHQKLLHEGHVRELLSVRICD